MTEDLGLLANILLAPIARALFKRISEGDSFIYSQALLSAYRQLENGTEVACNA